MRQSMFIVLQRGIGCQLWRTESCCQWEMGFINRCPWNDFASVQISWCTTFDAGVMGKSDGTVIASIDLKNSRGRIWSTRLMESILKWQRYAISKRSWHSMNSDSFAYTHAYWPCSNCRQMCIKYPLKIGIVLFISKCATFFYLQFW